MIRRAFVTLLAVGALAAPALAAPRITSDTTPGASLGAYQTFSFVNAAPPAGMNPVAYERIRQGVEQGLTGKGYTKAAAGGDLAVLISIGEQNKTDVQTWGVWGRQLDVRQYTEGQLSVDVFDAKTKQPLWHGQATETVNPKRLEPDKVEAGVAQVMARFPGRAG